MMYDNCNQCPRNNTDSCPFALRFQDIRAQICQLLRLPLQPIHDSGNAVALDLFGLQDAQETEYGYEDFHHIAFAADTPDQQAGHFQTVLISAATIADFKKKDITRCRFFVNDIGNARAEFPAENWLP